MEQQIKVLGKVCITVDGDWDSTKEYERLCMVSNPATKKIYISKMFVPSAIDITNTKYWQLLCSWGVINNLVSEDAESALSANMGKVLKELIDNLDYTITHVSEQHEEDIKNLTTVIDNVIDQHASDIDELRTALNNITSFNVEVVTELPTTGQKGVIYLVKSTGNTTDKAIYTEYIWVPSTSKYEILGEFETAVDLNNYQDKLVSGNNIKTINGLSLLGSGNINTTPDNATTSKAGLMSAEDKQKLDSLSESEGSKVTFTRMYASGTKIGTITINGVATDIYIPIWVGTKAQYDAIANKDSDITYNIIDA